MDKIYITKKRVTKEQEKGTAKRTIQKPKSHDGYEINMDNKNDKCLFALMANQEDRQMALAWCYRPLTLVGYPLVSNRAPCSRMRCADEEQPLRKRFTTS